MGDDVETGHERLQATVAAFDVATGTGQVLLDDGVALDLPAGALRPGSARFLRRGQRVVVQVDTRTCRPVVRLVHLLTVPPGRAASAASTPDGEPRRP
ncbi:hypothetical protein BH20ACT6_BH20ACT6_12240 [soil metagenome]